jgi:hypothetical protein
MTPWQEVRALAEKATAAETVARHAKPGTMDARIADDTWHAARAELSRAAMALIRDPAFIGMMEDAARYRYLRTHYSPGPYDQHRLEWYLPWRVGTDADGLDAAIDARLAGDGERGK